MFSKKKKNEISQIDEKNEKIELLSEEEEQEVKNEMINNGALDIDVNDIEQVEISDDKVDNSEEDIIPDENNIEIVEKESVVDEKRPLTKAEKRLNLRT